MYNLIFNLLHKDYISGKLKKKSPIRAGVMKASLCWSISYLAVISMEDGGLIMNAAGASRSAGQITVEVKYS